MTTVDITPISGHDYCQPLSQPITAYDLQVRYDNRRYFSNFPCKYIDMYVCMQYVCMYVCMHKPTFLPGGPYNPLLSIACLNDVNEDNKRGDGMALTQDLAFLTINKQV